MTTKYSTLSIIIDHHLTSYDFSFTQLVQMLKKTVALIYLLI